MKLGWMDGSKKEDIKKRLLVSIFENTDEMNKRLKICNCQNYSNKIWGALRNKLIAIKEIQ